MNRRKFLQMTGAALVGAWMMPLAARAEHFPGWEPMIYKRFFSFTEYEKRPGTEVIVVHHAGMSKDKDTTAAAIHKFHQETNGWAGIGYHYLIRKDGMIEQGRLPDMIGAHAYGHNKNSVGICLAGNYDIGKPPEIQVDALKELTAWLCRKYGINPWKDGAIVGHRDVCDTACPGKNLYKRLDELRAFCHDFE